MKKTKLINLVGTYLSVVFLLFVILLVNIAIITTHKTGNIPPMLNIVSIMVDGFTKSNS